MTVAIDASSSMYTYYSGGVINNASCGTNLNHGVTVIGYGHDSTSKLDYWLLKNSWGTWWGEQGFFRMMRDNSTGNKGMCGLLSIPTYPLL